MKLGFLLGQSGLRWRHVGEPPRGWSDIDVSGVVSDSRKAREGSLFVAFDGLRVRGLDYAAAAVELGAVAVVTDQPCEELGVPVFQVDAGRVAVGRMAAAFHQHPSRAMAVLAVTGTNGKTTTAVLAAQWLNASGHRAAAIGTLGTWTEDGTTAGAMTTPDAADLQAELARLRGQGFSHVAIEASSHALDQDRLEGVHITAAAWLNLSRDHLDYHGDEATYGKAKARLFHELLPSGAPAFVNGDDPICDRMRMEGLAVGWSLGANANARHQIAGLRTCRQGISFNLHAQGEASNHLAAPLLGRHNAINLTAAFLLCRAAGVDAKRLCDTAAGLVSPRGRLEPVDNALGALVLVDYAHTPDALAHALGVARDLVTRAGRLVVVFGCGGDRDRGKRPEMGRIAGNFAHLCVATSDNPRNEPPEAILADVEVGLKRSGASRVERLVPSQPIAPEGNHAYLIEPDRSQAIRRAVSCLRAGDVLIVAGKGHETTQTMAQTSRPFDDLAVTAGWLSKRRPVPSVVDDAEALEGGVTGFAFAGAKAQDACGGVLRCQGQETADLQTDSRKVVPGDLFVALAGDRFDGNEYVGQALEGGAAGVLCATGRGEPFVSSARETSAWLLEVDDTLSALGDLARCHRRRSSCPVVGVTGSNGKTTTKELLDLALSTSGSVLATHANFNNRIGVPLTLARLHSKHNYAVVEMGTSEPGEIAELARISEPDVGLITCISEAHLEGLGTLANVAAEKASLLAALPESGVAIVPAAEPLLQPHCNTLRCRVIRFGDHPTADVRLVGGVRSDGQTLQFGVDVLGHRVQVSMPGIGLHMADNVMATLAVAAALDLNLYAVALSFAAYQPVGRRMRPLQIGSTMVLEDCYNANPRSCEVALRSLASLPGPRLAVLGDMLELGDQASALHARVGSAAARLGIDALLTTGAHAADYADGALDAGMTAEAVMVLEDIDEMATQIMKLTPDGGSVLVKGSRGARMERVIEAMERHTIVPEPLEVSSVSLAL